MLSMTMIKGKMDTYCLSSLAKVFPDEEVNDPIFNRASALLNETYSFQVAYRVKDAKLKSLKVKVESVLEPYIEVRSVGLVHTEFPVYDDHDPHILRATPGLYPDPLYPLQSASLPIDDHAWHAVWVTVNLNEKVTAGIHPIKICFETEAGEKVGEESFELEVIAAQLPKQQLTVTNWFHSDCLATYYDIDVFSEAHWDRIEQYVETAAKHGMNMLLTPLFTLPLDTEIGGERPTAQLVEVEKEGESYTFGFEKLARWIDMATKKGIRYIEFSHLFTQWGVAHAPKIMAKEAGEMKQIFGWETDAHGEAYQQFLMQFLPELVTFIKAHQLEERVYFHVSDEPNLGSLEAYQKASELLHGYLSDYPIIDALSDYQFYEDGLVKKPIPSNDALDDFLQHKVPDLWTYYCCSQYKKVSNRFLCFPSARNRISSFQFYKFNITGFLHWGYNFWYSRGSTRLIDPFTNADADKGFPAGDAFLVYPGEEGPIESIRLEVFYDVLQDLRAFELLASFVGKEKVLQLIEGTLEEPLTFKSYPRESEWLLAQREAVNRAISDAIQAVETSN